MSDSNSFDAIAIDGGGTRCRVAFVKDGKRTDVSTGSANVSTNFSGAIDTIVDALADVANKAGSNLESLKNVPAFLGLAGAVSNDISAKVAGALPLSCVRVTDDRVTAMVGALGKEDGAVVGVGTGSFVARQNNGIHNLAGGYGFHIADQASGAWLGREMLVILLQTVDGILDETPFTRELLAEFHANPEEIVGFSFTATPEMFGSFAPRIVETARLGDSHSASLMRRGATYICDALEAVDWSPDEALCLIGSVSDHYAPYLPPEIVKTVRPPKGSALDGALLLARLIHRESMAGS